MLIILRSAIYVFRKWFTHLFFIILAFILLTGFQSTTEAQRKFESFRAANKASLERYKLCVQEISNNPAYKSVYSRGLFDLKPTLAQLADNAKPTAKDIKIIIAIHNDRAKCRTQTIEDVMQFNPKMVPIFVESCHAEDILMAKLIQRKITWGECIQGRLALVDEFARKMRDEANRLGQEFKKNHEIELAQRQAAEAEQARMQAVSAEEARRQAVIAAEAQRQAAMAAAAQRHADLNAAFDSIAEWGKQMQSYANQQRMNRPLMTNCQRFGDSINCTTY